MTNPESFKSTSGVTSVAADDRNRQTVKRDEQGLVATTPPVEQAVVVGVELAGQPGLLPLEDSLTELALLADTAGGGRTSDPAAEQRQSRDADR